MEHATIAIDLAKTIFEVGISDRPGHVSEQHRRSRKQLPTFLAHQPHDRSNGSVQLVALLGTAVSTFWT
jgi:hypothetical protein